MEDKYAMAMRQCLDKTFTSFVRVGNFIQLFVFCLAFLSQRFDEPSDE